MPELVLVVLSTVLATAVPTSATEVAVSPAVLAVTTALMVMDAADPLVAVLVATLLIPVAMAMRAVTRRTRLLTVVTTLLEEIGGPSGDGPAPLVLGTTGVAPTVLQDVLVGPLVAVAKLVGLDVDAALAIGLLAVAQAVAVVLVGQPIVTTAPSIMVDVAMAVRLVQVPVACPAVPRLVPAISPEAVEATAGPTAKALRAAPSTSTTLPATVVRLRVATNVTKTVWAGPTNVATMRMGTGPLEVAAAGVVLTVTAIATSTVVASPLATEVGLRVPARQTTLLSITAIATALVVQAKVRAVATPALGEAGPTGLGPARARLVGIGMSGLVVQAAKGLVLLAAVAITT